MGFKGSNFNDRMSDQKKAKLDLLKRAKAKQMDPEVIAQRAEERIERNKLRDERKKIADAKRIADAETAAAEKLASEKAEKEKKEKLVAAQKARRDAKYAARKARR